MVKTKNKSNSRKRKFVIMIFENPRIIRRTYGLFIGKKIRERRLVKIAEVVVYKNENKVDAVIYNNVKADIPVVLYTK